ncbi:MAG: ATP-binding cassette domain-containing protein [Candidatus Dormibacteria bacterium]
MYSAPPAVQLAGLTKRYGSRLAVDHLNLEVQAGEIFGFLGPNGSGKTTTIRLLLGLIRANSGRVRLFGEDLAAARQRVLPRVGSMVEQPGFHPYLSGRDNLRALGRVLGVADAGADRALARTGLSDRARDRYSTYSLGMKQRLGVAAALLGNPSLLVLDEPANGLDPLGIIEMRNLLRELAAEGITVFLSSHILAEVSQVCDRVGIVRSGRLLLVDRVADLLARDVPYIVDTPTPELAQQALAQMAGASGLRLEHGAVVLEAGGFRGRDLLSRLAEAGVTVDGLRRADITLEEIFLRLTEPGAGAEATSSGPDAAAPAPAARPSPPLPAGYRPEPLAAPVATRGLGGLFRAEVFKLARRPLTWGLVGLTLFFVLAAYLTLIYTITNHPTATLPGHLFAGVIGVRNVIVQQLTLGRRIGEFSVVALAGATVGVEFSSGSLRVLLARGCPRWQVLASKYVALGVFALLLAILATLEAVLLAALLPLLVHSAPGLGLLNPSGIEAVLRSDAGVMENWLGVIALGSALAVVGRSTAVGIGGGLAYLIAEDLGGHVLPAITTETHSTFWTQAVGYLFTPNLNAAFYHAIPVDLARQLDFLDGAMPSPMVTLPHALLVGAVFAAVLLVVAAGLFTRQDWAG